MFQSTILKNLNSFFMLFLLISINAVLVTDLPKIQPQSKTAAPETSHFGRLIENWEITDSRLDKNGKWRQAQGAEN
jgi:hypothetical protein